MNEVAPHTPRSCFEFLGGRFWFLRVSLLMTPLSLSLLGYPCRCPCRCCSCPRAVRQSNLRRSVAGLLVLVGVVFWSTVVVLIQVTLWFCTRNCVFYAFYHSARMVCAVFLFFFSSLPSMGMSSENTFICVRAHEYGADFPS